jgi:hypothetical protein
MENQQNSIKQILYQYPYLSVLNIINMPFISYQYEMIIQYSSKLFSFTVFSVKIFTHKILFILNGTINAGSHFLC